MNDLINIASLKYRCKILSASSSKNKIIHPPSSIINQDHENVWISGQGLPQQIIISLQDIQINFQNICSVGFCCEHDYDTNPKSIQIWVAKDKENADNGQYVHWQTIAMKRKRGKQMFNISQIPQSQRIIKILITQTYGEFQTYLNKIILLAQPDPQSSSSLFNQQEWNKMPQSPSPLRKPKNKKGVHKKPSNSQHIQDNIIGENSPSPLQLLNEDGDFEENSKDKKNKLKSINANLEEEQFDKEEDIKNPTLLAMNKNMIVMQDNIQSLTRKVQILQKKVAYTYQNLQLNIMRRVQQMIDKKIHRKLVEKQYQNQVQKKIKSYKQLVTSRTQNNSTNKQIINRYKQKKVLNLVAQLNDKLKQRVRLANRLQQKQKYNIKSRSQYYD